VPTYLIDANLPYRFSLWQGPQYVHVFDLNDSWTDLQIWDHARRHNLTIVSKDADFSALAMASDPPPRVVHLRIGNLKFRTCTGYCRLSGPKCSGSVGRTAW
jgi:predicted nuclease of predicted toxin-antitoxin system